MKQTFIPFTSSIYKKIIPSIKNKNSEENFSGICVEESILGKSWRTMVNGKNYGFCRSVFKNYSHIAMSYLGEPNGYEISYRKNTVVFSVYDMGVELECVVYESSNPARRGCDYIDLDRSCLDVNSIILENKEIVNRITALSKVDGWSDLIDVVTLKYADEEKKRLARLVTWAYQRRQRINAGVYKGKNDIVPYYVLQKEQKKQIIKTDNIPKTINYIASVGVAFDELSLKMVGAIVIFDAHTLYVVDKSYQEVEITFPYLPKFYSFHEVPPLVDAYQKLSFKPDLIICTGHGMNHPMGVGVASHLGLELDIPTIAWSSNRLVGDFETIKYKRGKKTPLLLGQKEVGKVLCTQNNEPPIFVSIGHRISIETACDWILKLCSKCRTPEISIEVKSLIDNVLRERTVIDFPDDFL